jgi:hypothetical protein
MNTSTMLNPDHEVGGYKNTAHGFDYQLKLLQYFALSLFEKRVDFEMLTEITAVGKFDDGVIAFEKDKLFCFQAKHKDDACSLIKRNDMFKERGPFNLIEYFSSFLDVMEDERFFKFQKKYFYIITNANIKQTQNDDDNILNHLKLIDGSDKIMNLENVYKFNDKAKTILKEKVEQIPAHLAAIRHLANELSITIIDKKPIDTSSELFKVNCKLLGTYIFDLGTKKFSDSFINSKDTNLSRFRTILEKKIDIKAHINITSQFEVTCSQQPSLNQIKFETIAELLKDDIEDFLNNFYFAIQQPDLDKLDQQIDKHLQKLSNSESFFNAFRGFIFDWLKDKKSTLLTNKQIELVLDKDIIENLSQENKRLLEAMQTSFVTENTSWFQKISEHLLSDEKILKLSISKTDEMPFVSIKIFQVLENPDHTKSNIYLTSANLKKNWHKIIQVLRSTSETIFIVEFDQNMHSEIPNLCDIITDDSKNKFFLIFEEKNLIAKDNKFNDLTIESQAYYKKKKINFQGHEIDFKDLLYNDEVIDNVPLTKFIKNEKFSFEPPKLDFTDSTYITRTLKCQTIVDDSIRDRSFAEKLIISNEEIKFVLECERIPEPAIIHWLTEINKQLVWQKSRGSLTELRKFIKKGDYYYSKAEDLINKVNVISDLTGMGKSYFLNKVAQRLKQKYQSDWVLFLKLNDLTDKLSKVSFDKADSEEWIKFFSKSIMGYTEDSFESVVFKQSFLHEKCHVVVDGFDEICPDYKEKVMDFIKALLNTNLKSLYVSTRPQMKEYLENCLNVFAFEFKPFDEEDQIKFLTQYLKDEKKAEQIVKQLPEHLNGKNMHIAGIPLQLKMIADILQENKRSDKIIEFFEKFDIGYLYDQFVEKKHDIYLTEKLDIKKSNIRFKREHAGLSKNCNNQYFVIALITLFNKKVLAEISFEPLHKDDFHETGIILKRGINQYKFIHRTFAEYFAAIFFLENNDAKNLKVLFKTVFVEKGFETVRAFCNAKLRKDGIFETIRDKGKEIGCKVMSEFSFNSLDVAFRESNENIFKLVDIMYPLQNDRLLSLKKHFFPNIVRSNHLPFIEILILILNKKYSQIEKKSFIKCTKIASENFFVIASINNASIQALPILLDFSKTYFEDEEILKMINRTSLRPRTPFSIAVFF